MYVSHIRLCTGVYESVADFSVFMVDIQLTQAGFIFRNDVRPCHTVAFLWTLPSTASLVW